MTAVVRACAWCGQPVAWLPLATGTGSRAFDTIERAPWRGVLSAQWVWVTGRGMVDLSTVRDLPELCLTMHRCAAYLEDQARRRLEALRLNPADGLPQSILDQLA